jgi:nicotinamide-nucleotide amidase
MQTLIPLAEKIAARLIARKEKIAIAEGSAGGLISAALLAVPGASAYFLGGAVVYTIAARRLIGISDADMKGIRAASEPYALLLAQRVRERHEATWGLSETGAAGPTGNRYGDPAGHTCIGVAGPTERAITLRTGSADRQANMRAFSMRALELLAETVGA